MYSKKVSNKARINKLLTEHMTTERQHIVVSGHNFLINDGKLHVKTPGLEGTLYKPSPTGEKFHTSNTMVRLIIGPYGSGKSTTCCAEIIKRTCEMPFCSDGVRRSKWVIIRNTYGELQTTSLKTWLDWFGRLGTISLRMDAPISCTHIFNDGKGLINMEILFMSLDREKDIRKLKSLEITGAYLNELAEIPQAVLKHIIGRRGRYPSNNDCPTKYWTGIIADTNPPDVDHWLYNLFEVTRPSKYEIFHQPPACLKTSQGYVINPEAENLEHLPLGADYYLDMMAGQTEEFIKVYVLGQYGTVIHGKFVYNNYNDDLHSVKDIQIDTGHPLSIGWDYGTVSPACLICQRIDSQLRVIKEFVCEYMTAKELYKSAVEPFLSKYCQGMHLERCKGDPADTYDGRAQLAECGLDVDPAKTNNIDPRIRVVRDQLNTLIMGKPMFVLSRTGCPKLRQGFLGKYNYQRLRVIGEEKYQDVPNKTHPYSDIHDCLQYICLDLGDVEFMEEEEPIMPWDLTREEGKSDVTGY